MPELPEVETVRAGLALRVVGRRIERVEVGRERTVRRTSAAALIDGLSGTTITAMRRRGKYLLGDLDSGDQMMIHLRMSGRVLIAPAGAARPPHTHVVMHLGPHPTEPMQPEEMWFVDPRTFGEVVVFDPSNAAIEMPELARLGIDPIVDDLSRARLAQLLRARSRQLKPLLLDQHVIAGIGNIYCDETLHAARLMWNRPSDSLKPAEITRLHDSIHRILGEAIEAGGSTLADTQYVDVSGEGGWFQLSHKVYDRAGQPCLTCQRAVIRRVMVGGRSTCYCPRCQK
jgi:formamidopyrimidine-DNA glycosylase